MKKNSRLAFVIPILIYVLAGLGAAGSYAYVKVFEPGRNKKVADQAAIAAAQTQAAAASAKSQADLVASATATAAAENLKAQALRDQIDQNAAGFVEGAKIALQADPTPSQPELVATALLDSATQALGQPLTPQQRAVWTKTVAALIAKNAEAEAQVAQLTKDAIATRASLDAVRAHAAAADTQANTLAVQLDAKAKEIVTISTHAAQLTEQNAKWADGTQTLLGRLKAAIALAVIGIVGWFILLVFLRGKGEALKDAVALGEHVKKLAVTGEKDIEGAVTSWWADDPKARKIFDKYKSKLRI